MRRHDPASHGDADCWTGKADWYDRVAEVVEPEMRRATDAMLDAVRAGPGTRLLDLACGPGYTTAAARERGAEAMGLDVAPGMIENARRRFPESRFSLGDMRAPPAGPWDAITCRLGAHHAEESWIAAAWSVLAPGGRMAIAEFGAEDQASRDRGMRPPSHWVRLFEAAGFEDVAVTTRALRLGALAARDPVLAAMAQKGHGSPFRDGPVHVVSGRKRLTAGPAARVGEPGG